MVEIDSFAIGKVELIRGRVSEYLKESDSYVQFGVYVLFFTICYTRD